MDFLDGATLFTFEYPVRSNTGTPFRGAVITSDDSYIVVPAAEKINKDCIMVYSAKNGVNLSKIPIKIPGFKVFELLQNPFEFFTQKK